MFTWGINYLFIKGRNLEGQLGSGDYLNKNKPKEIKNLKNVVKIYAGGYTSFAITGKNLYNKIENNILYSWGKNDSGELGVGDFENKNTPEELKFFNDKKIIKISNGRCHSLVLTGNLFFFIKR